MHILKASIALLGLLTITGPNVANAAQKQQTASNCYVDDGYGRKRACSAGSVGIKRTQNVSSGDCSIDDGYGRKRPCSAGGVGIKR